MREKSIQPILYQWLIIIGTLPENFDPPEMITRSSSGRCEVCGDMQGHAGTYMEMKRVIESALGLIGVENVQ